MAHFRGYWLDRWDEIMCGEDIEAPDVCAALCTMRHLSQQRHMRCRIEIWQGATRLFCDVVNPSLAATTPPTEQISVLQHEVATSSGRRQGTTLGNSVNTSHISFPTHPAPT